MPTILEQLEYGFDRDSRRTWRRRSLATGEDNAYGYDGLSQVVQAARGNLNLNATAIGAVPTEEEAWNYDPTGNWHGYRVEKNGAVTLEQERVHDKGNRLMQIEGNAEPVLVDRAGRMVQVPPDASGDWGQALELVWDAWSRLVAVKTDTGSPVASYAYDGLTRRTTRTVGGVTWHTYYSDAWRPLEERQDSQTAAARQYYWGARHRDDLVRRDRATTSGGSLNETRYVLMDYFSPAALTDASGNVTERYAFSAFGVRRIMAPDFSPRTTSECAWDFAFQGQFLDTESGFYNYGYRSYSPALGRWLSKDPIGEKGGLNLYGFVENTPPNLVDLLGYAGCSATAIRNCKTRCANAKMVYEDCIYTTTIVRDWLFFKTRTECYLCKCSNPGITCTLKLEGEQTVPRIGFICTYDCPDGRARTVMGGENGCPDVLVFPF